MRIENKSITVTRVLFSKQMSFVYFLVFVVFVYKSLSLLPTWLSIRDKADEAKIDYEKKVEEVENKKQAEKNKDGDMGRERYQKEFFNKLDEGENMIVLYGDEEKRIYNEQERKMFWWTEQKQNFLVWWRNFEIFKY